MTSDKWHKRYLDLAKSIAQWSKDPRRKVGAVVTKTGYIVGQGFNGFPKGIEDSLHRLNDKSLKNLLTIHAESNALFFAKDIGDTIYIWPCLPCTQCLALIMRAGIKTIVTPCIDRSRESSWNIDLVEQLINEVNIELIELEGYYAT
jgi:dCMP deaminase